MMTTPTADSSSNQNADTKIDEVTDMVNEQQEIQQDQSLTSLTLTLDSSSAPDSIVPVSPPRLEDSQITIKRNPPNRRKMNHKRRVFLEKKWEKKVEVLLENYNPIPFNPIKSLDFSRHEALLKRLGLWDFVHMEFDRNVRKDLVAQFIASFSPTLRCSYVNGARIKVSRADLARALRLPVKNVRAENVVVIGKSNDLKSRRFIGNFLSTWVLLHNDTWMMPSEIMNWTDMVREGKFEKVDWAGLLWFMVEHELKEINGESGLENCYYASHMQCLIKYQREQLFTEETQIENDVKEEEDDVEIELGHDNANIEGEDTGIDSDVAPTETRDPQIEDLKVEASHNKLEDTGIDSDVAPTETRDPQEDLKVEASDNKLEDTGIDFDVAPTETRDPQIEDLKVEASDNKLEDLKVEEEIDMEVEIGKLETMDVKNMPKDAEIETVDMEMEPKFSLELSLGGNEKTVAEFSVEGSLMDNACAHYDNEVVVMDVEESNVEEERQWLFLKEENSGGSFLQRCNLGNFGGTTEFEREMNVEEEDESEGSDGGFHISPNSSSLQNYDNLSSDFLPSRRDDDNHINAGNLSVFGNGHKRKISHSPRIEDSAEASEVLDQAQYFLAKAKNLVAEKDQALRDANANQQILLGEVHARDCLISQLQKETVEEKNKREMEVYRRDKELGTMCKLLQSYRNALKQSQRAFSEYRERCPPVSNELSYKDVPGSGGLVLCTVELERQRVKQVEEEKIIRLSVEKMMKEFEDECMIKFEEFNNRADLLNDKLLDVEIEAKLITDSFAKCKTAEVPDSPVPDVAVHG